MSSAFSSIGDVLGNVATDVGGAAKTIGSDIGGIFSGTTPTSTAGGGTSTGGGGGFNLGNLLKVGLAGAGLLGNYLNQRKIGQATDQQLAWQKFVQQTLSNPAAFQKFAAGYTQPLTAGLTQGVLNQDQAWLAQHGLSQSPAIAGDVVNQSLAPYIQQQQNQGIQNAINALGIGSNPQVLSLLQRNPANLTGLLQSLMKQPGQLPSPQSVGTTGGILQAQPTDINPPPSITASNTPDWGTILGGTTMPGQPPPIDIWSNVLSGGDIFGGGG